MKKPINVLMVEDNEDDAELMQRMLKKGDYVAHCRRVETLAAFTGALDEQAWDLILCDYRLPGFSGTKALSIYRERALDIPFIFVSGTMGEETAVEAMTQGAHDYVMKNNLTRLLPAIGRELKEAKVRIERRQAVNALQASESSMQAILRSTADGILAVDSENKVLYANERFAELWMIPKEIMAGKDDSALLQHVLDQLTDPQEFLHTVQELYKSKEIHSATLWFKDGRVFERLSRPIMDGEEMRGRVWSFRDITKRTRSERLTEALFDISKAVYTTDNVNELFRHIHRVLSRILPANNFFIALLTDDGKTLYFPYKSDEKDTDDWPAIGVDDAQSLTVEVLKTKESLLLDERELLDRFATGRNKVWGTAPKCWLGVPLMTRETVIGVMAVQDYDKSGAYSQKDVTLFESAAGQIAVAIGRKRAEDALRESEHRTRTFLDSTSDMAFLKDDKFRHLFANRTLCKFYGKTEDEIIRKKDFDLMSEKAALRCRKTDEQTLLSNALTVSEELIGDRCYETVKFPVEIAEGKVGVGGYIRDITERKRAEETLREKVAELQRWQCVTLGREDRVGQLKREINDMLASQGQPPRYPSEAVIPGKNGGANEAIENANKER